MTYGLPCFVCLWLHGYKYYVVFVDDFSQYTWFYPLHAKSNVYECFIKFKVLTEKQFSTPIKQLQSNGGGEFISNNFQSFLTKHGIVHWKSCTYTFQQNGLVESKLRNILEAGLTLLAHSHLSNRYWVDSFLSTIYLINSGWLRLDLISTVIHRYSGWFHQGLIFVVAP
jgi:transposase InsO family protein